jgi:hypothetical protein
MEASFPLSRNGVWHFSRWRRTMPHWLAISMLGGRRRRPKGRRRHERRWRRKLGGRRWWWRWRLMRAKALWMSGLGGSSFPRVVQGLSILLLAHDIFCWSMTWCYKYLLDLCDLVCGELDMRIMHLVCCKLYAWELDGWWLLVYINVYIYILVYMCLYECLNSGIYECLKLVCMNAWMI